MNVRLSSHRYVQSRPRSGDIVDDLGLASRGGWARDSYKPEKSAAAQPLNLSRVHRSKQPSAPLSHLSPPSEHAMTSGLAVVLLTFVDSCER